MRNETDEKVARFVRGITRGPFKCLNDERSDGTSAYVVSRNPEYADIHECAVYQAYLDMCRTVDGAAKGKKKKDLEGMRSTVAGFLQGYFAGKPKTKGAAFDGWHGSALSEACAAARLTCGQGQKILNMAFKYLYCCSDIRESKQSHFSCCHMALDGYTLAWYKRECDKDYDGEAWSAIDDIKKYSRIQNNIRKKIQGESVFLDEFAIWQEEKARSERNEIKKAALKVAAFDECPAALKEQLTAFASGVC